MHATADVYLKKGTATAGGQRQSRARRPRAGRSPCDDSGGYVAMRGLFWRPRTHGAAAVAMTALAAALTMQIAGMQNASTVPVPPSATTPRFIPGALHVGKARASAPDVAQCQQQNQLPCYDPAQIDQAYSLTGGNSAGSGVTIAIVDTYGSPTIASDLATFDSQFGLAALKLSIIRPAGPVPKFNSQSADMVSWAGETTLDVEWAHAIAPEI